MSKRALPRKQRGHLFDPTAIATRQMHVYCAADPDSPSALHRPRLLLRGQLWVALLGPSLEEGIVGIGPTVESALRAFDTQYVAGMRRRSAGRNRRALVDPNSRH
jgi:hypothetical protein